MKTLLKELKLGNWIAVAPGASYPTKKAPEEIFAEILNKTLQFQSKKADNDKPDIGLLFLGDTNDRKVVSDLVAKLNWPFATLNLAGKLSLWESSLAVKQARVLLSNDSSLAHIAEAVDIPAAVLFGPTIESFGFAPHLAKSRAFSSSLGCRPCSKHGKTPCRFEDMKCFTDISRDEVADFLVRYL